ncbi:head GIN domain-containing protein [Thermoflexibacter ruber]|uniref:Putative auto-transporter adhesin, head GIN domain n=1 Tax=Thermoflexibacter ruber TaxID=1003 RepID=A0A1I2CJN9_9BACT|nr:head GIN domain-containing protein [Thermoflexibacter ruber]SFE67930.1 Putative auto-transporter adhesin, head GIN domain [Thermoflexibacter ruber]
MKKHLILYLMIVLSIALISQSVFAQKTEERKLEAFKTVKIGGSFNVTLQEGNTESVKITASGIDLDDIITENEGSTLNIRIRNDKWNSRNNYNYTVDIVLTYKNLEKINSSGSSRISTKSTIKSEDFELALSGSGKFKGALATQRLNVSLSGSGDIEITGNTKEQSISISGSGDVQAIDLKSSFTKINISGSGNAKVHASEELDARVSGSGDIRFAGNPQKQIFKSSGSGSIKKVN